MSAVHPSAARHSRQGWLLAAAGAVLFSAKAILAKFQYRYGLGAVEVMSLRMLYSLPLFVLLAIRESLRAGEHGRMLDCRDAATLTALGLFGYYLSSLLDFWGLEYVPVSLERLLLFLNPTFVALIGLWVFRRPVTRRQWTAMAVCYAGVALVMVENLRIEGEHIAFGSALVFGAALSYAVYLAVSGELIRRIGALRLVAWAMIVSTAATLLHAALAGKLGGLWRFPWQVQALALANALFCTFLPVTFSMAAIARIGSASIAQLSVLGPVSLVFLGHWLLGEHMSALQLAGTAVVLGGVALLTRPAVNSLPLATVPDRRD